MVFPQRHVEELTAGTELHQQAMQALVERTCKVTGRAASEFSAVLEEGTPYACIVGLAEQTGAELIVVGDRGASGLSRMLLGSVAERVVRYAHAPVLIARAGARTGKVLVATDLSDPSMPAIAAAAREARRNGVTVTAIHCVEPMRIVGGPDYNLALASAAIPGLQDEVKAADQKKLAEVLEHFGLNGESRTVVGTPAVTVVSLAEELAAELIVIGTRGKTGLKRVLLGSVAESIVRHAPCSVLVVRLVEK
jgi:nucleotide-binding universal stress UspA family protein